ncbi:DNA methyltransferase [Pigmentiphaga litoralis]|uniref:DNA cytosine methyltransferase n=1 Tax=Pigmentiphaga litoralis TaxID=516702 RepID=UPI001676D550|nr:DNA cytosine methyltransferase [Pigmentiphaga litoralis]GGX11347.1 DNA methyltransferase [Pigmentiphaga litoralis]
MRRDDFTLSLGLRDELIIDNFAGGGGTSTGLEAAFGRPVDIAINHDAQALAMHAANHPHTRHLCESVWDVDPIAVTGNQPVALVWLSPDCKHFSKAKGGKPVEKRIRGLAWVGLRWVALTKPRMLMLENVEEFKTWGPLIVDADGNAKPDPAKKGKTFDSFVRQLRAQGYTVDWRDMRACDFGAPTIRKRFFLVARRDGLPIVWPVPTHGAPTSPEVMAGRRLPWRTAAECIDWSIACPSIFNRSRELADATKRRIAKGIMRYVVNSVVPYIVNTANSGTTGRGPNTWSVDEPLRTVTSAPGFAAVAPTIVPIANWSNGDVAQDAGKPLSTVTAHPRGGSHALAAATLVAMGHGERQGQAPRALDIEKPLTTITAGGRHQAMVSALLVDAAHADVSPSGVKRWGTGTKPVDAPLGTILASGGNQAIAAVHLTKFRQNSIGSSAAEPVHTITAGGGAIERPGTGGAMGVVGAFLAKHYTGVIGSDLHDPIGTVTATDHHSLVTAHVQRDMGASIGHSANDPLGTVTAGGGGKAALVTSHIAKLRGTSKDGQSTDGPLHTVSAGGTHHALVTSHLLVNNTGHPGAAIDAPTPTVTSGGHHAEVRAFLMAYYGTDQAPQIDGPLATVTARDRFGLVTVEGQDYQIVDIGLRMLTPRELFRAQGFPDTYIIGDDPAQGLSLTKSAQVRMCGNSVCPPMSEALVRANFAHEAAFRRIAA